VLDPELEYVVDVRRKVVDASYLTTKVPSTHPPKYTIHPGVTLVPINGIARLDKSWKKYVVIGAGKTGIDAVLRLLDLGVNQEKISWIVPNDPWMQNRDTLQVSEIPNFIDMWFSIMPGFEDGGDAYKNKILIPVPHPNHNRDFFVSQLQSVENDNRMGKEGAGFIWEMTSRLNLMYHIGLWDQAKLMVTLARRGKLFEDTLKKLIKNSNRDCTNE